MSENQDKLHRNGSQKPEVREPDAILPAEDEDFEGDEIEDEEEYDGDEDYYEDEDEDDEGDATNLSQMDPYALAQQLASSPLFAQVQAMLGGGNVEVRMSSARLQQVSGDLEGAAEIYLDIIEEDPEYQKAYIALGQVLLALDKPQEAEVFLSKAIELQPEDSEAYLYMGYAYYAQQNFEKCIEYFGQAVEFDPDSHVAINNLGYAQYLTGRLDEAEKTFIRGGDVGSNRAYYNLGLVRVLQGKEEKAWEAYQDAADLDPRATQVEDHLADLEQAKQRFPDKVALLDEAIKRLNDRFAGAEEDEHEDDENDEEEDEYAPKD